MQIEYSWKCEQPNHITEITCIMTIVDTLNCHLIREPKAGYWILPYGDANTFCVALEDELVVYKRVCLGHRLYSVVRESITLEKVLWLAQLSASAGEG